jgi:hypothetical protein
VCKAEVESVDVGSFRPSQKEGQCQNCQAVYKLQDACAYVELFQVFEGYWGFGYCFLPLYVVYFLFLLYRSFSLLFWFINLMGVEKV